jgi:hypothetical protein
MFCCFRDFWLASHVPCDQIMYNLYHLAFASIPAQIALHRVPIAADLSTSLTFCPDAWRMFSSL